eukprot:6209311-Pleurochrysis_carterae.AAC.2
MAVVLAGYNLIEQREGGQYEAPKSRAKRACARLQLSMVLWYKDYSSKVQDGTLRRSCCRRAPAARRAPFTDEPADTAAGKELGGGDCAVGGSEHCVGRDSTLIELGTSPKLALPGGAQESRAKELFTSLPPIHIEPIQNRPAEVEGVYYTPVYKTAQRFGVLSTT